VSRPALEVADIFRDHGSAWRQANAGHVSLGQLKVMSAISTAPVIRIRPPAANSTSITPAAEAATAAGKAGRSGEIATAAKRTRSSGFGFSSTALTKSLVRACRATCAGDSDGHHGGARFRRCSHPAPASPRPAHGSTVEICCIEAGVIGRKCSFS
jgi:hypothetical protein